MSNDAEAREVHATITDSEAPWEPVNGDEAEPEDRTDLVDEDDADEDDEDDEDEVSTRTRSSSPRRGLGRAGRAWTRQ